MDSLAAARSWLWMVRHHLGSHLDPSQRRARQTASSLLERPTSLSRVPRRSGSVWGVCLVKNEIDVIETTLRHQLDQGLDALLVADNGSEDGTLERLCELADELPIHVAQDAWPAYYQALKMTLLASMAASAGADWIVPFDADELWFAREATVADHLRASGATVVEAQVHNLFPLTEGPVELATPYRLDLTAFPLRKVAFRAHRMASLKTGNHYVFRSGPRAGGLTVGHLPWRSLDQLRRKTRQGAAAYGDTDLPPTIGTHWRHLGSLTDDELADRWNGILAGEEVADVAWSPVGPFIEVAALRWQRWDPDHLLG